jgi:hypothetical protein
MTKYEYVMSLSLEELAEWLHYVECMAVSRGNWFDKDMWTRILKTNHEEKEKKQ